MDSMDRLSEVVKELLSEKGCPWDRAQTHESLEKYLIEECYEVKDAIENGDSENLCEELGDLLFQIVIHSHIAEKEKKFTLDDVCSGIADKMIRRHPNVFADISGDSLCRSWEEIKRQEKNYSSAGEAVRNIAKSLPALMRAEKIQEKAEDAGYDFGNDFEETIRILYELENDNTASEELRTAKMGEILFKLSNISRKFKINSEFALTNYSEKFINRFEDIEDGQKG